MSGSSGRSAKFGVVAAVVTILGLSPNTSNAALITTNSLASPTTVDFSQFVASPVISGSGAIQIGGLVGEDIEYSGNPDGGLYAFDGSWGLADNGSWGARTGYIGQNNARPGEMIITFNDGPVSGVGGFMNHCPSGLDCTGAHLVISAFDIGDVLLESYDITLLANISTPGGFNEGAFRGISRANNDIASFHVSGYVPVLDDLAFSREVTAVPEPTSLALTALGLLGLASRYHRRRRE